MQQLQWGNPPEGLYNFPLERWQQQGRLAEYGIELTAHTHLTGQEYAARIRDGAYDLGHIGTPVFLPAARTGHEYAVISVGLCGYAPFYFLAAPGIRSLRDCTGKRVVINKWPTCPGSLLRWHAHRDRVSLDDLQVVELMAQSQSTNYGLAFLEAARRGEFAAGILYEPYVSLLQRELGWSLLADYPALVRPANYAILLYARRRLLAEAPEVVSAAVSAYFASAREAVASPGCLASFAGRFADVTGEDIVAAMAREAPHWQLEPGLDQGLLQRVQQELRHQALVPPDYRIATSLAA